MRRTRSSEWIVARKLLVMEQFMNEHGLDWNKTAERFGIHPELGRQRGTLQRKLADSGTSFRELTDDIRKAMATRYLSENTLQINEIAFLLGFSDISAFSRSARNWFGVAPREYLRQQH